MIEASQTQPRLPDDLERLVDPALPSKPDGLTVACYTFPHYHRSAYNDRLFSPGWTEYVLRRGCVPWFPGHQQPRTSNAGRAGRPQAGDLGGLFRSGPPARGRCVHLRLVLVRWPPLPARSSGRGLSRCQEPRRHRVRGDADEPPVGELVPDRRCRSTARLAVAGSARGRRRGYVGDRRSGPDEPGGHLAWSRLHRPQARSPGHPCPRLDGRSLGRWAIPGGRGRQLRTLHPDRLGRWASPAIGEPAGVRSRGRRRRGHTLARDRCPLVCPPASRMSAQAGTTRHDICPSDVPEHALRSEWPGNVIVVDETPAAFEARVRAALAYLNYLNARPEIPPDITIGCWNEWTEGHYLLPDTRHGFGMLRALDRALGHM